MPLAEKDIKISTTNTTSSESMNIKIPVNTNIYDATKVTNTPGNTCSFGQGKARTYNMKQERVGALEMFITTPTMPLSDETEKVESVNKETKYEYRRNLNILIGSLEDKLIMMYLEEIPRKTKNVVCRF